MEKSNINPTSIRLRKDLFEKIKKDAEKDISLAFINLFTPQYSFHFYPL